LLLTPSSKGDRNFEEYRGGGGREREREKFEETRSGLHVAGGRRASNSQNFSERRVSLQIEAPAVPSWDLKDRRTP
jgi:hypothetical protein